MLWMYAVCALSMFVCLPFFLHYKRALRLKLAAAFKSLGTLCAAALALIAALRLDPQFWICFAALCLHAAADWSLEFSMLLGAGFFIAGHICYIGFFTHLCPVSGIHLIAALFLLGITAFLFWRWRKQMCLCHSLFYPEYPAGTADRLWRRSLLYQRCHDSGPSAFLRYPCGGLDDYDYLLRSTAALRSLLPAVTVFCHSVDDRGILRCRRFVGSPMLYLPR